MRLSRQIGAHLSEVERLRRAQIRRVQEEWLRLGLRARLLGQLLGKPEVRGWQDPDWDPPQSLLDAVEAALFDEVVESKEPLVSAPIASRRIVGVLAPRNLRAVEIWNQYGGVWSDAVATALSTAGVLGQSTMLLDREEGLYVESRGDEMLVWPSDRPSTGIFLSDRPDPAWNEFVLRRVMVPLSTWEPHADRCRGWSEVCRRTLRYIACLLPFASSPGGAPDRVLSVVTSDRAASPVVDCE